MFSLVALLYKLDLITPSFKTILFSKFVIKSLFVNVLFFMSLNISNFLDLVIGINFIKVACWILILDFMGVGISPGSTFFTVRCCPKSDFAFQIFFHGGAINQAVAIRFQRRVRPFFWILLKNLSDSLALSDTALPKPCINLPI